MRDDKHIEGGCTCPGCEAYRYSLGVLGHVPTNTLEWAKTASAQEIFEQIIDRPNVERDYNINRDVLQILLDRANAESNGAAMAVYVAFASSDRPEAHACVKYNFTLSTGETTTEIGKRVFRENFNEELKKRGK